MSSQKLVKGYLDKNLLWKLVVGHIFVISLSNYLVQIPVSIGSLDTTWGAFSFPLIYLMTDLTVRLTGSNSLARRVVLVAMIPALIVSYIIGVVFMQGKYVGVESLGEFNTFVFRIALASFSAYVAGQLLDILVFSKLRNMQGWWVAPSGSSLLGNALDSMVFWPIAFYASTDAFMANNWVEIGLVDYGFKVLFTFSIFLPIYGALLNKIQPLLVRKQSNT